MSGSEIVANVRAGSARKGLRRLFHGRAHALRDADEDEERHRREREELREQHAREPIDPAAGRHVERPLDQLVHDPRAAEDEDQAQPDDEGRRHDGEDCERADEAPRRERRARHDEREGEPEQRAAGRREEGEEKRVPRRSAP
jgi:hypothetical protein